MADPINMDQMLEIFNKFSNQISESLKENNIAITGVNAQLAQIKVDAVESSEKIASDIKKLTDSTSDGISLLSNRLGAVEAVRSSRTSSRAATPVKIAEPLTIFEPIVIAHSRNTICTTCEDAERKFSSFHWI